MLTFCICDDEALLRNQLRGMLEHLQWSPHGRLAGQSIRIIELDNVDRLLSGTEAYDILFLDIRFSGKDLGMEAARELRRKGNNAIFILLTSLSEYATEGYEVDALRYLVKPVTEEKLTAALDAALSKMDSQKHTVIIRSDAGMETVYVNRIIRIESAARRRIVYLDDRTIETWESIADIHAKLPNGMFALVQKGIIVNLSQVSRVKYNTVYLRSGTGIPLSRNYKTDFMVRFNQYVGGGK
jgi:DNA-binding LytR/AlgR family response regulator